MVVAIIVLAVVLSIVLGYAARQREELHTAQDKVEELLIKNADLENTIRSHEISLGMLLSEIEKDT